MHPLQTLVFYAFSAALLGCALIMVSSRNVFHSAVALTGALAVVAGFYALLGADFLAAAQLLIYVGGIMIIMLFVVMFSQQPADTMQSQTNDQWVPGALFALAVASALIIKFGEAFRGVGEPASDPTPTSAAIGRLLLGDLLVPFEAVSLVLLAALVGAVFFAQREEEQR